MGVHGLVYGAILGAALHLAVQVPGLIRYGFRWFPRVDWRDPGVRKVLQLMGPRILTIGAFQLIFVIQDNLASRVSVGSVTALTYGWLIMQVPETLIGTAIATALLPTIAEHFARGDDAAFEAVVARAVRVLLVLTLPVAVVLGVALRPLVQLAFDFDARGTELVVWASRAYLAGLVGHSLLEVAARAFYARQNARLPMAAAALGAAVFVLASLALYQPLEATGIALANSLAFTVEAIFLLILLARAFPAALRVGAHLVRAGLAAAVGGAACYLVLALSPWASMLTGILGLAAGAVTSLPLLWPEVRELRSL
jgi:putative peptidoglycan lipid II flippase